MTLGEFVFESVKQLSELYSREESRSITVRLLSAYLDIPEYKYISEPDKLIPKEIVIKLQDALSQLCQAKPLQYVLGFSEFAGNKFKVEEGVLIPRPETEELFRLVVNDCEGMEVNYDGFNILDACTGSGCLAYSLAQEFPEAQVYGCDISDEALNIAFKQKIKITGAKPIFFRADILMPPPAGIPQFDVIVSNPPYVCNKEKEFMRPNVLKYEPHEALFVPDDDPLLFYRALTEWISKLLKKNGKCFFEINEAFGDQMKNLMQSQGFKYVEVVKDINGKDRFVVIKFT
ncbi:MAG: peptide chain release factor N(5)-glutamine methyltransferase [Bacteroidales bacterium]|nr:peptide chain release factor N(5)-glutamine methyltransferase [Bacteroidales bacterium]